MDVFLNGRGLFKYPDTAPLQLHWYFLYCHKDYTLGQGASLSLLRRLSGVLPEIQSDAVHLYIGLDNKPSAWKCQAYQSVYCYQRKIFLIVSIFNNVGIHFIITISIIQGDYSSIYLFIPIIASKPTNIILHRTSKPLPQDNKIPFYKAAVILCNKPPHDYGIDVNQQKRICVITG